MKQEPLNASRLLEAIYKQITTLERLPHRCPLAPETELVDFEVRVLPVKRSLLVLFEIDDDRGVVVVLGFRHGRQRPLDLSDRRDD